MIKAWRCSEGIDFQSTICFINGMPCRTSGGECRIKNFIPCDRVEIAITPWAKHEKVQAALAAAEETMEFALQVLRKLDIEDWRYDKIDAALTQIQEVTK